MVVVDERLLFAVLAGRPPMTSPALTSAVADSAVSTTGSWYWRVARAAARPGSGVLSRALAALTDDDRRDVRAKLATLPPSIGLLPLRRLVPIMQALPGQLNLLTAEAIASALLLDVPLLVTTNSPLLDTASRAVGVSVEVVEPI
jgi:hypothetical protein